jgi:predicted RNA-binding protein with RPS1 domain/Ser-tRNA(Ala) deacylase AlaX
LRLLTDIQYRRSSIEFKQGMFHVLGDTVEIFPPGGDTVIRIEMPFDEIETIQEVDSFTGELITDMNDVVIFPASHNVTTREKIERAVSGIKEELVLREKELIAMNELAKAERIKQRTDYDLEMLLETGYTTGIENYVRYLGNREPGSPPETLLDYFPDDFLLFVDESHISVPQIGGMHEGNLSRKRTLVEYGFRLPSALDNRPLTFQEFESRLNQVVFVSATPGKYEYAKTPKDAIVEQIIRPTGLLDPVVVVQEKKRQIDHILEEVRKTIARGERILITTLTKKMAEDLTKFLQEADLKVRYLHSDIETLERIEILRQLRIGEIDIIVGINLLHEALKQVLGADANQKGSNITAERLRFDFTHGAKMTSEEIKKTEDLVNRWIEMKIPVSREEVDKEEAIARGAVHLFGEKYGDKVSVYTIGASPKEGKLIFSEKNPEQKNKDYIIGKYALNDEVTGEVTGMVDFGVFVKLEEGLEGLVHISEIDWALVENPKLLFHIGEKIKVKIIEIKDGKISLSIKALKENPWKDAEKKYKKDDIVSGVVIKFNKHGALASIEEGIAGLVHISEFGSDEKLHGALELGKTYKFKIGVFDPKEQKMTLSFVDPSKKE